MARLDRLGPAKEVAQIGAAIGREFSHALLVAVAGKPEAELASALDRLIVAGLLFRQGVPPQATYLFKHALVQDAAYGTLLREPRRALHARIAETLESRFSEIAENQPEVLARHFTEAGMSETAIQYWSKAGERALQRSANAEAAAHLTSAIELISASPKGGNESCLELRLQMALGSAARAIYGHAAPETLRVYTRARELLDETVPAKEQMAVLYGSVLRHFRSRASTRPRGRWRNRPSPLQHWNPTRRPPRSANRMMGIVDWATGDFLAGCTATASRRSNLRGGEWKRHRSALLARPLGLVAVSAGAGTMAARLCGSSDRSDFEKRSGELSKINHAMTTAFALIFGSTLCEFIRADPLRGGRLFDEALDYWREQRSEDIFSWSRFYGGLSLIRSGAARSGA